MIKAIEIKGLFGRFDYRLELKSDGITVLTGPNGFGKSTLFSLTEAVSKGNRKVLAATPFSSFTVRTDNGDVTVEKNAESITVMGESISFGEFVAGAEFKPLSLAGERVGRVETVGSRRFLDSALKSEGELRAYVDFIKNVPHRIAKAHRSIDGARLAKMLVEMLSDKLTFKRVELINGEPVFTDYNGDRLEFTQLSAGEIQLTAFYTELAFDAMEGTLLLVDEPEISMHIMWQFGLVDEVERICKATGAYAIIATHSPQILNGHFDLQVDLGEQYDG